jgi:hypothetical protein
MNAPNVIDLADFKGARKAVNKPSTTGPEKPCARGESFLCAKIDAVGNVQYDVVAVGDRAHTLIEDVS